MFNLSINSDSDDGPLSNFDRIYRDLPEKYEDRLIELVENKECKNLKSSDSGAFGTVKIGRQHITKQVDLLETRMMKKLIRQSHAGLDEKLDFIVERFFNYCKDVRKYIRLSKRFFKPNFVNISNCFYCNKFGKFIISVDMLRDKKHHEKDLKKFINSNMSEKELNSIYAQIFIVTTILNNKKIYHNDVKPSNILIARAYKNISYNFLGFKLNIKKNQYIPIFIDYDLHSLDYPRLPDTGDEIPKSDFDFFVYSSKKIKKISNFLNNLSKLKPLESNEIYNLFQEEGLNVTKQVSTTGGRKTKTKKIKKRKHSGINNQTGRLKKGYKYSGKKLKSGLPQIIKIKKK